MTLDSVVSNTFQTPFLISDFFMACPIYKTFVFDVFINQAANLFLFKSASY